MDRSIIKVVLSFVVSLILLAIPLQAQSSDTLSRPVYFVAGDENSVPQVFQYLEGSDQPARQITYSESGVIRFGVAYDGLGIAYVDAGQLWLQPIHTEEAEALATLDTLNLWTNPIFSQDGNYIAYADNGVWLYDLANRETRQILANVPLADNASNASEYRVYQPQAFVLNADGTVNKLLVDAGLWEWNTSGIYDLTTGEFLELEGLIHSEILPLSDGRALVFGNSGFAGEGSLHIADSLENINNAELLVLFHELTEATLFAERAVEISSGIVRILGSAITLSANPEAVLHFYFDFDIDEGTVVGEVNLVTLVDSMDQFADTLQLSPDASLIPIYHDARFADAGIVYGNLELLNIETGITVALEIPESVSAFQFQP